MAENLKYCHVCYQKHVSKPSTVWCSECEQGFCSDCETFHSSIQSSKSHVTIAILDYLTLDESIRKIRPYCSNHDEKYQMFCQTHDVPLCHTCIGQHSNCNDLISLAKLVKNLKLSETVNDIDESLKDIEQNVLTIKSLLEKNRENLDEKRQDILSEIRQTRKKVNKHLDEIENRLKEEVTDLYDKAKNQLESLLQSLQDKNSAALSQRDQVNILKKHGSDLQTFVALRNISSNMDSSEKDLQSMIKNGSFDKLSLECDINDKLTKLKGDLEQFGQIRLQKIPCVITLDNHKERQAQHVVCTSESLDHISSKLVRSFDTSAKWITGCVISRDGRLLLADYVEKCLLGFDSKGKHLFNITALYEAFDVTCIDDTNVAVTLGEDEKISIIDISSRTVKKNLDVGYECYGVTYKDGTLLVCAAGHGILSINLTTEEITTIVQCDLGDFSYITTYKDKLYYTDDKAVTCCDMKGNTLWTFRDDDVLSDPRGITTDNKGRVYVCDRENDTVVVLCDDGKQRKIILSVDDGINGPCALFFGKKSNYLFVANGTKEVFLFNVIP